MRKTIFPIIIFLFISGLAACLSHPSRQKELMDFQRGLKATEETQKINYIANYLKKHPKTSIIPHIMFYQAQLYFNQKKYDEVISIIEKLQTYYPYESHYFETGYFRAFSLSATGKNDKALDTTNSLLKKINYFQRGVERKNSNFKKHRKEIKEQIAIATKPEFLYKLHKLDAELLVKQKNFREALFQYRLQAKMLQEHFSDDTEKKENINFMQAFCYSSLMEFDAAISLLQKNIVLDKKTTAKNSLSARNFIFASEILRKQGKSIEAVNTYVDALSLNILETDREKILKNISTVISSETSLKDLLLLFHDYKGAYPAPEIVNRILYTYNYQQQYKLALDFLDIVLPTIQSEDVRQKLLEQKQELETKLNVKLFKIGFITTLTGKFAPLGQEISRGVRLAIDNYNDKISLAERKLILIEKNSYGDAAKTEAIFDELIRQEGVSIVIGPILTKMLSSIAEKTMKYQVVTITPSTTDENIPKLSPYIFRDSLTEAQQVKTLVDYCIAKKGMTNFAVIYPNTKTGNIYRKLFVDYVKLNQRKIILDIPYPKNTTDFSNALNQFKDIPIEGLFIPDYPSTVALVAPQLKFNDIEDVLILGTSMLNSQTLLDVGGKYVNNIVFTDDFFLNSTSSIEQDFIEKYKKKYGLQPTRYAAQAYDAVKMFILILNDNVKSRADIYEKFSTMKEFKGVSGNLSITEFGDVSRTLHLLTVKKGSIVELSDNPDDENPK